MYPFVVQTTDSLQEITRETGQRCEEAAVITLVAVLAVGLGSV